MGALPDEREVPADEEAPLRPPTSHWRRTFSALHYRDFRLLWIGALTSTTGTWMQTVAQAWLVFSLTDSPLLLGVDAFLSAFPMVLFSLLGGAIADRYERRRIMLLSQFLQMSFAFVLAALIFFGRVEVWHIFVLSFLTGTAQSFSGPAYASLLPTLVKKQDVPNAVAMNSIQFNLARVIGPVIAGFALATIGAAGCFALNGLSFIPVIFTLFAIRPVAFRVERTAHGILEQIREGFRYLGSQALLVELSIIGFLAMFLAAPFVTLLPVVSKALFSMDARGYSWLLSAYGLGSVGGALIVAWLGYASHKGRLALYLQLVLAVLLIAFAASRSLPLSLVLSFLGGAAMVAVVSVFVSLVQLTATDAMRGRVMSIFMLAFRGGVPLGSLVAGWAAQRLSVGTTIAAQGVLLGLVGIAFLLRRNALRES